MGVNGLEPYLLWDGKLIQQPLDLLFALDRVASSKIEAVVGVLHAGWAVALERLILERERLLILDIFEQIIEAAPAVHRHLARAAGLKALISSREVLRLYGEHGLLVSPLDQPELGQPIGLPGQGKIPSVVLFVQRARAVQPDFQLTEANAGAVAAACVRLDGLPLAIELAAAWIKMIPVDQLASRLDHRLAALERGPRGVVARHQTLPRTLQWSHDLLAREEARLLARASRRRSSCLAAGPPCRVADSPRQGGDSPRSGRYAGGR